MVRPGRPSQAGAHATRPATGSRRASPVAVAGHRPRARGGLDRSRVRVPRRQAGLPQLYRDDGRRGRGRSRPSGHRVALLDRQELPGSRPVGRQDLRQRHRRRARARGHVRRRPPRRRAHVDRDDAPHPPLAGRRLRRRPADHVDRGLARDLDRVHGQSGRRGIRHLRWQVPQLAQEPPADARHQLDRHRPQPQLRLSLGRRRSHEREPGGHHLPRDRRRSRRRRTARCAPSWPVASSAAASRSGPRSRSTSRAGWSCGRTATR